MMQILYLVKYILMSTLCAVGFLMVIFDPEMMEVGMTLGIGMIIVTVLSLYKDKLH